MYKGRMKDYFCGGQKHTRCRLRREFPRGCCAQASGDQSSCWILPSHLHTHTHTQRVTVKTRLKTRGHSKPEEQKDVHIYHSSLETPSWLLTGAKRKLWSRLIRASCCSNESFSLCRRQKLVCLVCGKTRQELSGFSCISYIYGFLTFCR